MRSVAPHQPADGATWSLSSVAVPRQVRPGEDCTFDLLLTAPAVAGTYLFAWRMSSDSAGRFGEASEALAIAVTPVGEPAACAELRRQVSELSREIEELEARMTGDPRRDAQLQGRITELNLQRERSTAQMTSLGCV